MRELDEADFRKSGIYGSARVWANAWDVFRCASSRGGRGRWAGVHFVACFGWGGFFRVFFLIFFFLEGTRLAVSMIPPCLIYLFTSTGVRTGCHYFISLSVRLFVSVLGSVCATFVVFTDFESCTKPISTNPGSMEAGEYGLTRGTCFVARHLEVAAVAGLSLIHI